MKNFNNYEEFKAAVIENIMNYVPEEWKGRELKVAEVTRTNEKLDGLTISDNLNKVTPTIYINNMYNDYCNNFDFEECIKLAVNTLINADNPSGVPNSQELTEAFKNKSYKVIMQIMNTKKNEELLKNAVHRDYLDMSIVYRFVVGEDATILINNNLAAQYGYTEEELFNLAYESLKEDIKYQDMTSVLDEIFCEMENEELPEVPTGNMTILSNRKKVYGAASMLLTDVLDMIATKNECNFFILPSSIHEVILVKDDGEDDFDERKECFSNMVYEVNYSQVSEGERLSNNVYYYDREAKAVTQITDAPEL